MMGSFVWVFRRTLRGDDHDVTGTFKSTMPFVPFPGLYILGCNLFRDPERDRSYPVTIQSVGWVETPHSDAPGYFLVDLPDHASLENRDIHGDRWQWKEEGL